MPWDLEQIKDCITQTDSERAPLVSAMHDYERAWRLEFWTKEEREAAARENRRLYTSPTPRNLVSLGNNLISGRLKVRCPSYEATAKGLEEADLRGRFLEMLIAAQAKTLDQSLVDALGWFGLTRGRQAIQWAWLYDIQSPAQRLFQPPILYRPLDPIGVGIKRDHLGTAWAYHRYKEKAKTAEKRYPDLQKEGFVRAEPSADGDVTIVDFWWVEKGRVWNAILIDDQFVKKPKVTKYPQVPIFERNNDPTPAQDQRWRSASILEGFLDTWANQNTLMSMYLSSIYRYFWPTLYLLNENREDLPPIDTGMDAINELPPGTKFISPPNNVPDANLALGGLELLNQDEQESTFPGVLYGDAGQMKAAYGMNLMASTALRRIRSTKEQMQILLESANEMSLWAIQQYAPSGVTLYGMDKREKKAVSLTISAETIGDRFDNTVLIDVSVPGTAMQDLVNAIQLKGAGILSAATVRDDWLPSDKEAPMDEETRILIERIEQDPDLMRMRIRKAYADYYGEELPEGEPDFEATPQEQPAPPPMQPPMQPQGGPLPEMPMPQPGMGGFEFQGGISPEMMGLDPNDPETQMIMQALREGRIGPQDAALMIQDRFRRR